MFCAAILSLLLGQCGPNGCSMPVAPSYPSVMPSAPSSSASPSLVKRWVKWMGVDVLVEGVLTEQGTIRWEPTSDFNRASMRERGRQLAAERLRPADPTEIKNYGVDSEKLRVSTQPNDRVRQFIEQGATWEAGEKLHLTVIGTKPERDLLINDLNTNPAFTALRGDLLVQAYEPGDWAVDPSLGFPQRGVLLQDRKGKVLYRAMDYSLGPEGLAKAIYEARRIPSPNYDPSRDPGPATGNGDLPLGFTWGTAFLLVAALAVAYNLPRKP